MFIWLASYPKSGNTYVRSMLSAYFFSNDGIYNFDLIKNIKQFPDITLFENLGINIKDDGEVVKNYIRVQESFCQKKSIQFLKTHSYLFNINNKYPFTDLKNSIGAIYIVRDPRNVVTSFAKFADSSIDGALDSMINQIGFGGNLDENLGHAGRTRVWTGTWAQNYNSWKSFKFQDRYLLVKYEDLISDTKNTFLKILKFIHKLNNSKFSIDMNKFNNVLKSTSFENMKKIEKKEGFNESQINKKTGEKIPFFNLGPDNNWKTLLDPSIKKKIENSFENEMKELGYL